MKSVVYDKSDPGDRLSYREVEKPNPGIGEVLVKIAFNAINAADYRSMAMGIIPKSRIFGADDAGVVEALGSNVSKLKVGDEVFGDLSGVGFGGFAEYVAAPEDVFALKPGSVPFDQAAALPMASLTALQALRDKGEIQPGMQVLIYGAGGGVGTFAVQLAKYFGAQVTAICGPNNVELVRALGADQVIDYSREDFSKGENQFDLILGVNGSHKLLMYDRMLAPKGKFVAVGGGIAQVIKIPFFSVFLMLRGKKLRFLLAKTNTQDLEFVVKLVQEGKLKAIIDRVYPLQQTAEAMRYLSQGHVRGKVLIEMGQA